MLDSLNNMLRRRVRYYEMVDAEHLVTRQFDPSRAVLICHAVFVASNNVRIPATFSTRLNVAGNVLTSFDPDR
jgi:hypothetical protein